jgi:hypothetical protein
MTGEVGKNLYAKVAACTRCRDGDELIRALPQADFKFHWISYWYPDDDGHSEYVFLAWESSFANVNAAGKYPRVGCFNEPLHFAIRKFLACTRYLITNMAKCTIRTRVAKDSRTFRYSQCVVFLRREMELAGASRAPIVVAIGKNPAPFIKSHPEMYSAIFHQRAIPSISHYGRFADEHRAEFEKFRQSVGEDYKCWLYEAYQGQLEFGWHYSTFEKHPEQDLIRLFKWSREMEALRREQVGGACR